MDTYRLDIKFARMGARLKVADRLWVPKTSSAGRINTTRADYDGRE
jgi:hypothetical protein